MPQVYDNAVSLKKREFVNMVFDTNLYYKNGNYRTPTMMVLKIKNKEVLIYEINGLI